MWYVGCVLHTQLAGLSWLSLLGTAAAWGSSIKHLHYLTRWQYTVVFGKLQVRRGHSVLRHQAQFLMVSCAVHAELLTSEV